MSIIRKQLKALIIYKMKQGKPIDDYFKRTVNRLLEGTDMTHPIKEKYYMILERENFTLQTSFEIDIDDWVVLFINEVEGKMAFVWKHNKNNWHYVDENIKLNYQYTITEELNNILKTTVELTLKIIYSEIFNNFIVIKTVITKAAELVWDMCVTIKAVVKGMIDIAKSLKRRFIR